uniref:SAM domain-containing protein n=1 Tax=Cynoglossus semilaevis TaxID=244447 RepID=A0A3P8W5N2_CYNSE
GAFNGKEEPLCPDWHIPVPDTDRLDSSAHKARAQLAQKSKRHPPSRDKLRESFRKQVNDLWICTVGSPDLCSWFQSVGSSVGSCSRVGYSSDHSLSGHSHTFTFSSTEVRLYHTFLLHFLSSSLVFFPVSVLFQFVLFDFFPPLALMSHQTLDDDPVPSNNNNLWQSRPVLEWDSQQVCLWLTALNMEQYMSEFATRGVDGTQLLNMDTDKLKALGVCNQSDRSVLKKKLKEMKKREDKEQRKMEKRQKEEKPKDKDTVSDKENDGKDKAKAAMDAAVKDMRCGVKTVRTESLL